MSGKHHRGVALLEVLVAMTILSTTGLALTTVLRQAAGAQVELASAERQLDTADRVLAAMTLLTAKDLDQRIGSRTVGEFVTSVDRPEAGLYRIALADTGHPDRTLLATVVYRPSQVAR